MPRGQKRFPGRSAGKQLNKSVKLLTSMLSLETFETQVSAVMDTVVKAAVTELGTLLDKCSANAMAARQRSAPAPVTPEGRLQFHEAITVTHTHTAVKRENGHLVNQLTSCAAAKNCLTSKHVRNRCVMPLFGLLRHSKQLYP